MLVWRPDAPNPALPRLREVVREVAQAADLPDNGLGPKRTSARRCGKPHPGRCRSPAGNTWQPVSPAPAPGRRIHHIAAAP